MNSPLVAVFMVTYNHENYIGQAIESVLIQKTSFPIKLFIGEDCSTDNTAAICLKYKEENPEIIDVRFNKQNLGAINNAKQILEASFSSGAKYIAMLEGDDYWTDSYKLQKQVEFLDTNEDFVICHHNMKVIYDNDTREPHLPISTEQKEITTIEDLARSGSIFTASSIFRNGLITEFPEWFYKTSLGDYILFMLIAQYGKIKYFPDVMGVYRVHENGIWSKLPENIKLETQLSTLKELMKYYKTKESVYDSLKNRYTEICIHLINTYRFSDKNRKNEIVHLLNEVEPVYFYEKYTDLNEKYNKLYGSRKELIKALIKKQLYHSKKAFSHEK
jgi:glycosyltransferase involved in cell wall biosynthesis